MTAILLDSRVRNDRQCAQASIRISAVEMPPRGARPESIDGDPNHGFILVASIVQAEWLWLPWRTDRQPSPSMATLVCIMNACIERSNTRQTGSLAMSSEQKSTSVDATLDGVTALRRTAPA
jgi:hypothetical protein